MSFTDRFRDEFGLRARGGASSRGRGDPGQAIDESIENRGRSGTGRSSSTRRGSNDNEPAARQPLGGMPSNYRVSSTRTPESFRGMSPTAVEGWSAQGAGPGSTFARGPRYYEGDEWRPAGYGMEAIIHKQRALVLAGYLGADDEFSFGRWDDTTRNAYADLLAEANASGLTADEMLVRAAESIRNPGAGSGGEGGGRGYTIDPVTGELIPEPYMAPPLELKLPNRDELRAAFRRGVRTELGQGWDQAQIEGLVDAYIGEVTRVQTEAYNQAVAYDRAEFEGTLPPGGGGMVTEVQAPSAENFLDMELERRDPSGYRAGKIVNEAIPAFMQAIQGWGPR